MATTVQRITRDRIGYLIDRRVPPVATIRSGETVLVETEDSRAGRTRSPAQCTPEALRRMRKTGYLGNPVTGPIFVEGAEPGDTLAVRIDEIRPDSQGYTGYWPEYSHFPEWFPDPVTIILPIENGEITMPAPNAVGGAIRFPYRPMIGTIGTAPAYEAILSGNLGRHGGNLDCPDICPGHTLLLPVEVPGALLFLGDVHGAQGDGEFCAGGIEMRSETVLTIQLRKGRPRSMTGPRIETPDALITLGSDKPLEAALKQALREMILWMEEDYGFDRGTAYMLLTQVAEARVAQAVSAIYTMRLRMPRAYLGQP